MPVEAPFSYHVLELVRVGNCFGHVAVKSCKKVQIDTKEKELHQRNF